MKKKLRAAKTKSTRGTERLLKILLELAIVTTALFALSAPTSNTIYLFILLYAGLYPNPLVDFLSGSGFYLPYFALWHKLIRLYSLPITLWSTRLWPTWGL